jgi:hypothetical protein
LGRRFGTGLSRREMDIDDGVSGIPLVDITIVIIIVTIVSIIFIIIA